jgi:trk system potassium uptake protein TrkA
MKSILLIGLGRFGKYVAKKLNDLNHQVMAVDTDQDRVNAILPFVTNAQIGDSTNQEFMESLGVDNYDVCIVAIGDNFQSSLETAFLLKELGAKKVIARASKGTQEKILLRNGADQVVYPEKQLAAWCAITCTSDSIMDYIALNKEFAIFEMAVPSEWYGRSVIEIDIRKKYGINILGIMKDEQLNTYILPDTVFEPNTSVLVLGTDKAVHKAFKV